MSNLDIYHTAKVLVKHHGKDAPALAAIRADELLSAGGSASKPVTRDAAAPQGPGQLVHAG